MFQPMITNSRFFVFLRLFFVEYNGIYIWGYFCLVKFYILNVLYPILFLFFLLGLFLPTQGVIVL